MKKSIFACLLFCATAGASTLKVTSPTIKDGSMIENAQVFNGFGCSGGNASPEITWSGAPKDTKFFAVTMYDPDAPTGSGWWHWVVVNIPATVTSLPAKAGSDGGTLPEGAMQVRTDFGKPGYGGPCPPAGAKAHRYIFKVFALKDKVPVGDDATAAMAGFYVNSLKLAEGQFTGKFGRK